LSQFINVTFQEQKIKEGLYMMGLKDGIFHLSWFITYALQVTLAIQSTTVFFFFYTPSGLISKKTQEAFRELNFRPLLP
jgi:hypothetical protein